MNYCFNARASFREYTPKIYLDIKKRYDKDANAIFITTSKEETIAVKKVFPEAQVINISEYIKEHWPEFSFGMFCDYEKRYNCAPLWKYIYTDRFLVNRDYDYVIKITCGLFSFFETVFSKYNIDVYFSETIATLQCYVAYIVGNCKDVHYFAQSGARGFDSTHVYVMDDPFQGNIFMSKEYEQEEYSLEERRFAKEFWDDFLEKDKKPSYMSTTGKKPKLKLRYFLLPFKRLFKGFTPEYNNPYSYMIYQSNKKFTDPLLFYYRYQCSKKYYKKANLSQKYVLYPLHFQPEASTCVCAQKYEKQLFFIDSWAKSLPADTVLYVKEHYAILGHRELSFYKELKKYPNVVLIDPWENTRELIKHSVAVTTLTGTAGWEAMLLRKPVFIGGNIFFDNAPGVIKITDIYDNYLNNFASWEKPSEEQVIKYLCAYIRSLHPGRNWHTEPAANISNIVDSLITAIKVKNETIHKKITPRKN